MAPVSKNGKPYYTREQYDYARYSTSALEYAQSQGYELVRDGAYYHMKEHDSMIFTPRGAWFWNSRGLSGGALEFQIYYENKTITEAVLTLAEGRDFGTARPAASQPSAPPPPREPFTLPERADTTNQVFAYLCKTRMLDRNIVQEMMRQGGLYESVYTTREGKKLHNACFVSYDAEGNPCGAYQRGTGSVAFKREAPGSNKSYGWLLRGKDPAAVAVFEAAIDAASYATIMRILEQNEKSIDYLALGGVGDTPLKNYLEAHPNIREVWLGLDADRAGREASERIGGALREQGYRVIDITDTGGMNEVKDWNGYLQANKQELLEMAAAPVGCSFSNGPVVYTSPELEY